MLQPASSPHKLTLDRTPIRNTCYAFNRLSEVPLESKGLVQTSQALAITSTRGVEDMDNIFGMHAGLAGTARTEGLSKGAAMQRLQETLKVGFPDLPLSLETVPGSSAQPGDSRHRQPCHYAGRAASHIDGRGCADATKRGCALPCRIHSHQAVWPKLFVSNSLCRSQTGVS